MKRILITSEHSYIGNCFWHFIKQWDNKYNVDFMSVRDDKWKHFCFNEYDVVLHVAGIAHVEAKADQAELYYKVNRDLTIEIAKKAKISGVQQFIFMSSIIVYGENNTQNRCIIIDKNTKPKPSSFYGKSKLEAEEGINKLQDDSFNIIIIRAPMVYGKKSKGNFSKLCRIAKYIPIFPNIPNQRSMIYIENLCQVIKYIIDENSNGIFHPQNNEYVNTSNLVYTIARCNNHYVAQTELFNSFIKILQRFSITANKVFGTFVYEKGIDNQYYIMNTFVEFEDSIGESCDI
ncbi:hypothetical protein AB840_01875 [Megasphaera cerevisiae DSM 20462]|uniref:NAD-dependent epimerase/dehydratase domain-containing protein n=1 Tax=Megasphaera cerevisiae DSM 20462 TaxID=1122219 RepID=A0A0J6WVX1_9FIRM|nr:NAD-dependent epimerase/dehydratase family protein [Megasphaera cerevisiae]KMO87665.1 hypothetical protein AB840_01875 [Megasphaera cerevisiae DSM 20462]SKA06800.1 UDP-glucose 4-epimerase [Megasphaera cerevisiae DSM 20462]